MREKVKFRKYGFYLKKHFPSSIKFVFLDNARFANSVDESINRKQLLYFITEPSESLHIPTMDENSQVSNNRGEK